MRAWAYRLEEANALVLPQVESLNYTVANPLTSYNQFLPRPPRPTLPLFYLPPLLILFPLLFLILLLFPLLLLLYLLILLLLLPTQCLL